MVENISREEFQNAMLTWMGEVNQTLRIIAEFQEKLGEAIEMLAQEMGYEFTIKEDARA